MFPMIAMATAPSNLGRAALLAALAAVVGIGCRAADDRGEGALPMVTGKARFPAGKGVTSGVQLGPESAEDILFIQFKGQQVGGSAMVTFTWYRPSDGGELTMHTTTQPKEGELWRMTTLMRYYDSGKKRSRGGSCTFKIVRDGTWQECELK